MSEAGNRRKRTPGPHSLFGQIAVTLVCFVLAVLLVGYIFSLYRSSRNLEEQMVASARGTLERNCGSAEQLLDNLALLLNSTLMGSDVIPLAISPDVRDFENVRTITDALTRTAGSSTLIDAVYLYSVRADLGLSSDYTRSNYQDDSYRGVLSRFQTRKNKLVPLEAHGTVTYVYTENSDVYLIQAFSSIRYDKCSCYILFHLDSDQFFRPLNPAGDQSVYVFNLAGDRMFLSPDPAAEDALCQRIIRQEEGEGLFLHDLGGGKSSWVAYRTGGWTGWTFAYMTRPVDTLSVRYLHSNLLLVLAVLVLAGLCLIAIVWSARRISRPISRLVEKVAAGGEPAPRSQSEWEYLEQTYSHIISQKEELERYLPLAAESLHDRIFRSLLRQENLRPDSVGRQLALIHSPFTLDMPCAVFLADLFSSEEEPDELSRELIFLGLRRRAEQKLTEEGIPFHILSGPGSFCLICGFAGGAAHWERWKGEIVALGEERDRLIWGTGSPSPDLLHVARSLAEARSSLEFNRYYADQAAAASESEQRRTVFVGRIRELLANSRQEDGEQLLTSLLQLLQDLEETFPPEDRRQMYQLLLDLLLEKAAALKADCQALDVSLQDVPEQQLHQRTEQLCREMVSRLQGRFTSRQQMYVERAREYILDRYTDPNLSLESTAEYVGINATYLSRLFKNIVQQNFSTYLNQCRVDHAKRLLRTSEMQAQEIGYLTGFCSVATFFRVFKKYTGMTPRQFRQDVQGKEESP